jgi:YebC/PmpR family DNA-binding regulatory protein
MSGHSKWAKIKRKKGVLDMRRGQTFTKALREVQVAARNGGGSVEHNYRLRQAVDDAKHMGVPLDNIERAIKRGTGAVEGVHYEEATFEGYGPGGVALLIRTLTDNRMRTVQDVRNVLLRWHGSLATTNSVAFMFQERGLLTLPKSAIKEEELFDIALNAGAEDIQDEGENWEIFTAPSSFHPVQEALQARLPGASEGAVKLLPMSRVKVSGKEAESLLKLLGALEELDDVQDVIANFDMDEVEMETISANLR